MDQSLYAEEHTPKMPKDQTLKEQLKQRVKQKANILIEVTVNKTDIQGPWWQYSLAVCGGL